MDILKFFKSNIELKIIAILLALIIWFNAMLDESISVDKYVKINYSDIPNSMVLTNVSKDKILVLFEGKRRDFLIINLFNKHPYINIRVKGMENIDNRYAVKLDNSQIHIPMHIPLRIIQIKDNDSLFFEIDSITEKTVGITPYIVGSPADGYTMCSDIIIQPEKILIKGGRKLINKINYIKTNEIDISNINKSFSKTINLVNDNKFIELSNKQVNISVKIEKIMKKHFSKVPVIFLNKPKGFVIKPDTVFINVEIRGPESKVKNLMAGEISPIIDISNIHKKGKYKYPVKISLRDINILNLKPDSVEIIVK